MITSLRDGAPASATLFAMDAPLPPPATIVKPKTAQGKVLDWHGDVVFPTVKGRPVDPELAAFAKAARDAQTLKDKLASTSEPSFFEANKIPIFVGVAGVLAVVVYLARR
jgi:hypothetical protein